MATSDDVRINIIADTKKAIGNMAAFAAGIGAAILVAKKLVKVGADMVNAYAEQESAEARLAVAIRSTGREAEINQKALQDMASSLQQVTRFGDEATISAMAMLQQLGNLDEEGLKKVTPAMLDFAEAQGVSLQTAAQLIGKTLGSTTNALTRYGVMLDATAPASEKLAAITQGLNDKFGGTAEAVGATTQGKIAQYKNAIGDLQEVGGKMIARFLTPAIESLTTFATALSGATVQLDTTSTTWEGLFKEDLMEDIEEGVLGVADALSMGLSVGLGTVTMGMKTFVEVTGEVEGGISKLDQKLIDASAALLEVREELGLIAEPSEVDKLEDYIDTLVAWRTGIESLGGTATELQPFINMLIEMRDNIVDLDTELTTFNDQLDTMTPRLLLLSTLFIEQSETQKILNAMVDEYTLAQIKANEAAAVAEANLRANAAGAEAAALAARMLNIQLVEQSDNQEGLRIEAGETTEILERQVEVMAMAEEGFNSLAVNGLQALGAMFVEAETGAEAFKEAMKGAVVATLQALGQYAFAQAAIIAAANPVMAAIYAAGGAAAYVAAGAVAALAEGGIVNSPTLALIGESGPEAVVPLNKGGLGGSRTVINVYGNLLTERQLINGILRQAAGAARQY